MLSSFEDYHRIVIKIGSSLLIDPTKDAVNSEWLDLLIQDIVALHRAGKDIIIVSSGAIALGRCVLNLSKSNTLLQQKQAASAVGQIQLMHAYHNILHQYGIVAAQVLLTIDDSENRRRYINARNTLKTLFEKRAITVVNENDTVATSEICVGDNDRLAARVAAMSSADLLILLSDVDGLYSSDPCLDPHAQFIPIVEEVTPKEIAMAGGVMTDVGTGGMVTKIQAARIVNDAGCHMIICRGNIPRPLTALAEGRPYTLFKAPLSSRAAWKKWLASGLVSHGKIYIDDGAVKALHRGSSLLPAGIIKSEGTFSRGDSVTVVDIQGQPIARGLCAYDKDILNKISGLQSRDVEQVVGFSGRPEVVHRDNMVLLISS